MHTQQHQTQTRFAGLEAAITSGLLDLSNREIVSRDEAQRVVDLASTGVGHVEAKELGYLASGFDGIDNPFPSNTLNAACFDYAYTLPRCLRSGGDDDELIRSQNLNTGSYTSRCECR